MSFRAHSSRLLLLVGAALAIVLLLASRRASRATGRSLRASFPLVPSEAQRLYMDVKTSRPAEDGEKRVGEGRRGAVNTRSCRFIREGDVMAGEVDKAKGRVKKAVGELTDDEELIREGEIDEASGNIKKATEKVADKARDAVRKA